MTLILAAGFFSLIPPVYLLRLMADARKLEKRLLGRQTGYGESAQVAEGLPIKND
ncbi:MAG: hypothetical protein WCC00_10335 [Candidatus Aminicenantales bacterium]